MLLQDVAAEGLNFAVENHFEAGAFEAQVKAADAGEEGGYFIRHENPLESRSNQ
jgi:hypothetical protein